MAHLDALGNFLGPPQRRYDSYANTYNPGWKDYPNLSYGANPRYNQPYQNRVPQQPRDLGKLLSQTEPNLRQNVNAVTLQSGKVLEPIPGRLNQCRKGKEDNEIPETFRNVKINIPLLDAIKQILRYAKFLKELCTNQRKLTSNERVSVGENISTMLQQKLPAKYKDRGVIIQLADRFVAYPKRVLEDILVKVNELIFPANFYVIKMEEDSTPRSSDLLLGRPFLSTASTKIDI
ncbi:uncharacterized protein [Gossypium hirsutum]|uniref:Uncharacterized protein n=1 Tax=Gossypium hirsutum TaxID=3635 RepID=A0ABM2YMX3_GOSHI|nr:uncharacterized protein LOC121205028 [Gossypium hirsutum]